MNKLDLRRHAIRPDIADVRLGEAAGAARLVAGEVREVTVPLLSLHREPRFDSRIDTQALLGERVRVFETREGWAWLQLETDLYVGYAALDDLAVASAPPTHRVAVPSTFMFTAPDIKAQPVVTVTLNAQVAVIREDERFAHLANGHFVVARHLKPVSETEADFVTVAEAYRQVPYLWGGKSVLGIDCSGLVQLSLQAAGQTCPRDSDMQEQELGRAMPSDDLTTLQRGDLIFWDGHVGIMADQHMLLHANGHYMQVTLEPLADAVARIAQRYGKITAIKRL